MLVTLRHRRLATCSLVVLVAFLASLVGPGRLAQGAPPPNPTNGQISNAQQQKAALADQVGRLGARVAQMQNELRQLEAAKELAEQKFAYALSKLEAARVDAQAAAKAVEAAQARVDAAQLLFRSFVQATYMSGDVGGMTGSLLTSPDPNVVLQRSALQGYESDHQLDAIGTLKSATVAKSNADARARLAVQNRKAATDAAAQAKRAADAAVVAAVAAKQQLDASLAADQVALQQAQEELATLNNERAQYLAYQQQQAEIRAARLRAQRLAQAQARAAAARALAAEQASGSGGGNVGGGGGNDGPAPIPSGGSWTAARGQQAVDRAMAYLGWLYAWAGGNASGPTYGVCAGDGAFNDCHVRGFDCSGLTLYGWAPYLGMAHYAASQYGQAGLYHPSLTNLLPGDLLFWSSNGAVGGIHHVAMYVGGGNVIQAPESGSVIQLTPVGAVSWGYYGATRPLT